MAQPPTELPCNPFLDTDRYGLRIQCIVAVDRNVGDMPTDLILWFGQLGTNSEPSELLFDNEVNEQTDLTTEEGSNFYIYQSLARIVTEITTFDRFWCQINATANLTNDTDLIDHLWP